MNIAVLNGSPKGKISVTVQYVRYLQKKSPQHEFTILDICHDAKKLEDNQEAFQEVIKAIRKADMVLWATPVYVLLVPGPYKRFIELVFERSAQSAFQGKYACVLTTSVRFFDHSAQNYLNAVCDDLGMRFLGGYSAGMYELLAKEERVRLARFWEARLKGVAQGVPTALSFAAVEPRDFSYDPGATTRRASTDGKRVLILSDAVEGTNLEGMVNKLRDCFSGPVEVVNLNQIKMACGCQGCIQCGQDNVCVYRDADDVQGVYKKLQAADMVIEAGTIRDRFLSARWKTFWDRGFFNNHIPILVGKQVGFLISGPLMQIPNLRQILEASVDVERANLAGIVTDEVGDSHQLDGLIEQLARRLVECAASGYVQAPTFLGTAGRKLLRDEIWASLRFVFPADHRYYKSHGMYDFPRRSVTTRISQGLIRLLLKVPRYRREFKQQIRTRMIESLEKVVEEAQE